MRPLPSFRLFGTLACLPVAFLIALLATTVEARQRVKLLLIGAGSNLVSAEKDREVAASLSTLQRFIKSETGLNNKIEHEKSWLELADKLAARQLHLGVFHGYEFAWAKQKYPELQPLAVAVNGPIYPVACVVTRKDDAVADFAGLRGKSLVLTGGGVGYLKLFLDHQCEVRGASPKAFFSRFVVSENVEDALDDAVDGSVQAVVADQAGLDAYQRRKPGRFERLKQVARSQPFPPAVIAYYAKELSPATLKRFRDGILSAHKKAKGQTLLTLFHLTRFDKVPPDFDHVLATTRTAYPAPKNVASRR